MKKLLSVVFVLALCSSAAMADIPFPANCSVSPDFNNGLIVCPHTSDFYPTPLDDAILYVTVRNQENNPLEGQTVTVEFHSDIEICPSVILSDDTDVNGEATIVLAAAGCVHNIANAAIVRAGDTIIKTYTFVKSPANSDPDANSPEFSVGISSLISFATAYNDTEIGNPYRCMRFFNDPTVGIGDLILFAAAYSRAYYCI